MKFKSLRHWLSLIKETPLHPQWLIFKHEKAGLLEISRVVDGAILDIGAGHQPLRPYLDSDAHYVALDYFDTAVNWYQARPHIYADGQKLPVADGSFDSVLLLDVLEHLPNPEACIQEIHRILKPNGIAIIQVPFLYPIHDAPLDFHRWTFYGLRRLAEQYDFSVISEINIGTPIEAAMLSYNLAFSYTVLQWAKARSPLVLMGIFLPPTVVCVNLFASITRFFSPSDEAGFMPLGYRVIWKKRA